MHLADRMEKNRSSVQGIPAREFRKSFNAFRITERINYSRRRFIVRSIRVLFAEIKVQTTPGTTLEEDTSPRAVFAVDSHCLNACARKSYFAGKLGTLANNGTSGFFLQFAAGLTKASDKFQLVHHRNERGR